MVSDELNKMFNDIDKSLKQTFNHIDKTFNKLGDTMGNININGRSYQGNNITVSNGKIIIDGKEADFDKNGKEIKVIVHGNVENLNCHSANITGDVYRNVNAHNVECDTIGGNVDAHRVKCEYIKGKVDAHTVKTIK